MCKSLRNSVLPAAILVAVGVAAFRSQRHLVRACGPFFPNRLLIDADSTILSSPVAIFAAEVERILPDEAARFRANPPEKGDYAGQTARAEEEDLGGALSKSGLPEHERTAVVAQYARFRARLAGWVRARRESRAGGRSRRGRRDRRGGRPPEARPPDPDEPLTIPRLPREFALYARGAAFYHQDDTEKARLEWEKLLALPEDERRYRSVWATYMIGRTVRNAPDEAILWYERTRELTAQGYVDTPGLAAASYGWEARARLDLGDYVQAIHLYIEQYRTGDRTAYASLRGAASSALSAKAPNALAEVAADPLSRDIVTAFTISGYRPFWRRAELNEHAKRWLVAMEERGAEEVNSADRLGMIAYQAGDMAAAERWLGHAPEDSPLGNWLRAKLLARAGRIDEAAVLLARACRDFPEVEKWYLDADEYCVCFSSRAHSGDRA